MKWPWMTTRGRGRVSEMTTWSGGLIFLFVFVSDQKMVAWILHLSSYKLNFWNSYVPSHKYNKKCKNTRKKCEKFGGGGFLEWPRGFIGGWPNDHVWPRGGSKFPKIWPRGIWMPPLDTVGELKDLTLHRACVVKLPLLRAVSARQGWILPFVKWVHFFLGPWLLVYQFIEISNQMEVNGEVSNFERKFFI